MPRNKVVDRDFGYKQVIKTLTGIPVVLEAGFLEGISSADAIFRSYVNELGLKERPRRAHVAPAFDMHLNRLRSKIPREIAKLLTSGVSKKDAHLEVMAEVGELLIEQIRENILKMRSPQNAESTVRKKGFDDPLVETGHMADEPAYRLRDRRGRFLGQGKVK